MNENRRDFPKSFGRKELQHVVQTGATKVSENGLLIKYWRNLSQTTSVPLPTALTRLEMTSLLPVVVLHGNKFNEIQHVLV